MSGRRAGRFTLTAAGVALALAPALTVGPAVTPALAVTPAPAVAPAPAATPASAVAPAQAVGSAGVPTTAVDPGVASAAVVRPASSSTSPTALAPATTASPSASRPLRPTAADPGPDAPGPAAGLTQRVECTASSGTSPASAVRGSDPLAAVHRLADGDGQRVAVIDTGVSPHPRLDGRLIGGGDYLAGGDGLDDCDGHGTEVAGLIAAVPDPVTRTGSGVAPRAQVLSLRQSSSRFTVTGPDGRDRPAGEIGTLADAITRAVALRATVVNISEVVCVPQAQADSAGAPLRAAVRAASEAGVVVVAAAGNVDPSGTCTGAAGLRPMPALFDDVIAVAAVDGDDRVAPFSVPGPWVDVAAPGVAVASLSVGGGATGPVLNGTSYAAPVVAGVAALLRQRFPSLTPDQVADRIRATARHPAAGRDPRVGYGVLDPLAALTAEPLLLSPSQDPAGGSVTGPRTGTGPDVASRAGTGTLLPGLGQRRPDHTVALSTGIAAALVLLGAVSALLRRLRRETGRARTDRRPGPADHPDHRRPEHTPEPLARR
ncbi:membrane-anchored mycosin MYCP [Pseudonocardia sediminis]|uniref:Membrane-anchored mycosin MYCP n=1 Tax=Pseudonocardia sediminis TaxID=1397368 RepID=A0A4Q7V3Z6_PSEST|nr:type VII secretion-associated serine protease mycosin [Pseudonocardia sediminis]RZT88348.1 membrane-anchored mycosin MYCP [Pseudonocardia sediminis]